MSKLTATSIKLIMIWTILSCFFAVPAQGTLAFRTTFNDVTHVGTQGEYESEGSLGDGDFVYIRALSTDLATVAGQGPVENKAVQFDESGDELQIRRWVAPTDQFGAVDLTQVATGMSFGYWLMADTTSNSPMLLLGTRSGDMPNGNPNITHGLRHNGAASPFTSRRAAMEIWTSAQPATELTAGQWHHLVLTYSSGTAGSVTKKIYIDGSLASTPTTSGSVDLNPSAAHRIGGYWNGSTYTESFYGKLDQFDAWDTELSGSEVLAEYNAGPVSPTPPPTGDPNVGIPWLRFTFNDDNVNNSYIPNEGTSEYFARPYRNGVLTNLAYIDSPGGKALDFASSQKEYLMIRKTGLDGDVLPETLVDGGMSVAYWMKFEPNTPSYEALLCTAATNSNTTQLFNMLRVSDTFPTKKTFRNQWNAPPVDQTVMDADTWYHVVWTYEDPNVQRFYINGVMKYVLTDVNVTIGQSTSTRLGARWNSPGQTYEDCFNGTLDQFEIYDYMLNNDQVTTLFTAGPEQIETPQLFLRFTFNEYQGGVAPGSSVVANTGTMGSSYYGKTYIGASENTNATYIASPGNTALHINGSSDEYISFLIDSPASTILPTDLVDDGMSIAYWLRYDVNSTGYMSLLTTGTNGPTTPTALHHTLRYPIGSSSSYQERRFASPYATPHAGQTLVYADQWYHIGWSVQGVPGSGYQIQKFYLDGELVYTGPQSTVFIGDTVDSRFGITATPYREEFTGDLDQLDIYDSVLVASQMAALYAEGPVRTVPVTCAQALMQGYGLDADFGDNCHVDSPDFIAFIQDWLRCIDPDVSGCETPWN